jgi:hypothetical protein
MWVFNRYEVAPRDDGEESGSGDEEEEEVCHKLNRQILTNKTF